MRYANVLSATGHTLTFQNCTYLIGNRHRIDRFWNMPVKPACKRPLIISRHGVGGNSDHRQVLPLTVLANYFTSS